jgi:hypothetical protein
VFLSEAAELLQSREIFVGELAECPSRAQLGIVEF